MEKKDGKEQIFDIKAIAALARIAIGEEEEKKFSSQLATIVAYVDRMKKLDLSDLEPFSHVLPVCNVFDDDEVGESFSQAVAMSTGPQTKDGQIAVPRVVDGD
jgi:aspartyl-tRNA(Asn)/glutamyl-tRNA(Gln) amidotransferase subunit C